MVLIQRKILCIHFLHVTDLIPIFFQRNYIGNQKLLGRRKILCHYHLEQEEKKNLCIFQWLSGRRYSIQHRCFCMIASWFGLCCSFFWGSGYFLFAFHSFILTLNPIIGKKILSAKSKATCLCSTQEPAELGQVPFATQVIQITRSL